MARRSIKENGLTDRIRTRLKSRFGGKWIKTHGGPFQEKGLPDLIGCIPIAVGDITVGLFVGIEVKSPGKEDTLKKKQEQKLRDIRLAGGVTFMTTSPDEAIKLLTKALHEKGLAL